MILKKIRMVGFKSFVGETEIELPQGMTCIVGPNGCGKSNILDAVRWVLGEKSARGLRGRQMDDVIFLGSEQRKAAGMAEVEIVLQNRERYFNIDQDEVTIGRRLYLSSVSEYYLGGKRTTRREIDRLFMDTGIGKLAYSIMEQGRIAEILKATPEVRRALVDEVAGISRFKTEREESLSKLQATEANLTRFNDMMKGKKQQIDNLDLQARKTRHYFDLKKQLDEHDRNLRYLKYVDMQRKLQKAEDKLKTLIDRRDKSLHFSRSLQERIEETEVEERKKLEEMHRLDRDLHQNLSNLASLETDKRRFQNEKDILRQKREELKKRIFAEERKQRALEKKQSNSQQLRLNLNADLGEFQSAGKKIAETIAELGVDIQRTIEQEEEHQQALRAGEKQHGKLLEKLKQVTEDLILDLGHKKRELAGRESYRNELKQSIIGRLQHYEELLDHAMVHLEREQPQEFLAKLDNIQFQQVIKDFQRYEAIEEEFRLLLFDKSSFLARKELLDREMSALIERRDFLSLKVQQLQVNRKRLRQLLEESKNSAAEVDLKIRDREVRHESLLDVSKDIEQHLKECRERLSYFRAELVTLAKDQQKISTQEKEAGIQIEELRLNARQQSEKIDSLRNRAGKEMKAREQIRHDLHSARAELEKILPEISEQERRAEQIRSALSMSEENFYNDFQLRFGDVSDNYKDGIKDGIYDSSQEEKKFRAIARKIEDLGAFNALAIEELDRAQKEYQTLEEQRRDIESARKNIFAIITEIDQKSHKMFQDNFAAIEVKFSEIFQGLFSGGRASLTLTEPENPLASGVDIMVQPPGKKNTSISLLSGGEQSLSAIALMFAIYLVRPAPFCFLDEVDAALDDANVERFLQMLSRFVPKTQFIIITHNKLTMSFSRAIIGVTQEEAGTSKLISVRLDELESIQRSA